MNYPAHARHADNLADHLESQVKELREFSRDLRNLEEDGPAELARQAQVLTNNVFKFTAAIQRWGLWDTLPLPLTWEIRDCEESAALLRALLERHPKTQE